jgi:hypothetical protein
MFKGKIVVYLAILLMLGACMREPVAVDCRINRMAESFAFTSDDAEVCQSYYTLVKDLPFKTIYTNDSILRPTQLLIFAVSLTRGPERQYMIQSDGVISYYDGDRLKRGMVSKDVYLEFEQVLEEAKNK